MTAPQAPTKQPVAGPARDRTRDDAARQRVTLVTGGGSGIGAAVARLAADAGHAVVVCGRREAVLATTHAGSRIDTRVADVTDPGQVEQLVAWTVEQHGGLDHVVLNAGIMRSGTILDTDPAEWDQVLRSNLTSAYLVARAALPQVLAVRGSLVGVSSVAGLRASSGATAYATSKAALSMLLRTIAVDFGARGVRANVVCPGWVRTEMADEEMREFGDEVGLDRDHAYTEVTRLVPQRRPAAAEEVAAAVMWLLGPQASYVNGAVLVVDGGMTQIDPGTVAFDYTVSERDEKDS